MTSRITRVLNHMKQNGLSQLFVTDPDSIWYLTGIDNHPGERMYGLLLKESGDHVLFLNRLFHVPEPPFRAIWYSDTDDCVGALAREVNEEHSLGVDKEWTARYLVPLMKRFHHLDVVLASDCVDDCRAVKDAEEQRIMKEASRINDTVMEEAAAYVRVGMTEKELASYIDARYLHYGASEPSFTTIVSFGANAADPHHSPDETALERGQCVLIDMGCVYHRYCSDMTRTFFAGEPEPEKARIHDLVREANELAEQAIRPGVKLSEIDRVAREHIAAGGYTKEFNHRLGHFIGQRDHEMGDVSAVSDIVAAPGMIFSIEPGVYLAGDFGVRVEDLVLVTEDGCEVLNHVDKHWRTVG